VPNTLTRKKVVETKRGCSRCLRLASQHDRGGSGPSLMNGGAARAVDELYQACMDYILWNDATVAEALNA
jgi:hypothetical protein